MSEQNTPRSVSVVGLGPMGQSMVRALRAPRGEGKGG